jgi:hypothetical protein
MRDTIPPMTTGTGAPVRTTVVTLVVGCFSVAALLGVLTLLGGGGFGENEARVLLTTLLVGVTSVAVLCYLGTGDTPYQLVGVAGGLTAVVPLVVGLILIWAPDSDGEPLARAFGIGAVLAATFAQACLLLFLADGERPGVRALLAVTLVVAGVLALLLALAIIDADLGEAGARAIGVVAILDVLGTVVVAALSRLGADEERPGSVRLPAGLVAAVDRVAAATGSTREGVLSEAVREHLRGRAGAAD